MRLRWRPFARNSKYRCAANSYLAFTRSARAALETAVLL